MCAMIRADGRGQVSIRVRAKAPRGDAGAVPAASTGPRCESVCPPCVTGAIRPDTRAGINRERKRVQFPTGGNDNAMLGAVLGRGQHRSDNVPILGTIVPQLGTTHICTSANSTGS